MDDIDAVRRRKLAALQQKAQETESTDVADELARLEAFCRTHLSPEAFARYTTIKIAHPEKAVRALALVVQLVQTGRSGISDEDFKRLLVMMEPHKRETKIRRV